MAMRKRRVFALAAIVAVLVAGGLTVAFFAAAHSHEPAARASALTVKLGPAQQARLERGIAAPSIAVQATALAAEIRGQFVARGKALLPVGARILLDAATFAATSPQTATVRATVTGPHPGHWLLQLIKEGANWLLIGTKRLP
jgi:hypothetical protein